MHLEDYETDGRLLYERFAEAISGILSAAIRPHSSIHVQQIQHRAKDPKSLRAKLLARSVTADSPVEAAIKDLAGCRVVLYTNSDVNRFEREGIVAENFDIDWEHTKHHYPVPGNGGMESPFVSRNYVVQLKEDRARLPEYKEFAGLRCEIQVQTTLNHAWSETTHNILYKRPSLDGFGASTFASIEQRLRKIAYDYLEPAGDAFQKVRADFDQLMAGKELVDGNILRALISSDTNAERFELLGGFVDKVLPHYDDLFNVYDEIRVALKAVGAAAWHDTHSIDDASVWPGADHIVNRIAAIIERLRYISIEQTFDDIAEMYALSKSTTSRQRWIQAARNLASHNLAIWQKAGPIVQQLLIERLLSLDASALRSIRPLVLETLHALLETEASGTAMTTFESVTLSRAAIVWSPTLQRVRDGAIELLEQLIVSADNDGDRRYAVNILMSGWRSPTVGTITPSLMQPLLGNATKIIEVLHRQHRKCDYRLREHIEHDLWYLKFHCRRLPDDLTADPAIQSELATLFMSIDALRDAMNTDHDFQIFKILLGYEAIFPSQWAADDFDFEVQRAYRHEATDGLVTTISDQNIDAWQERLSRYAIVHSNDGADWLSLSDFLRKLGAAKPNVSMKLVCRITGNLVEHIWPLLLGIDLSGTDREDLHDLLAEWVTEGKHLKQIAIFLGDCHSMHLNLLRTTMEQAIARGNSVAVLRLLDAAIRRHADVEKGSVATVLVPGITYLSKQDDFSWVDTLWMMPGSNELFMTLVEQELASILDLLRLKDEIADADARLLARIATRFPRLVIAFFGDRVVIESADTQPGYRAVPYQLAELRTPLRGHIAEVIDAMAVWYAQNKILFSFRGGQFLASIFEDGGEELTTALLQRIRTHGIDDLEFVVAVLHAFNGETDVTVLCRVMVEMIPEDDERLGDVESLLFEVGGTTGEHGLVIAYSEVRNRIRQWLEDESPRVTHFAKRFLHSIEQAIANEQQRADQRLAQRKLNFRDGAPDST